eukprot:8875862-Pyramimonas_sp.AAC.1
MELSIDFAIATGILPCWPNEGSENVTLKRMGRCFRATATRMSVLCFNASRSLRQGEHHAKRRALWYLCACDLQLVFCAVLASWCTTLPWQ